MRIGRDRAAGRERGWMRELAATRSGRVLIAAFTVLLLGTIAGGAALWPGDLRDRPAGTASAPAITTVVREVRLTDCGGQTGQTCRELVIAPDGRRAVIPLGPVELTPDISAGDEIRVRRLDLPPDLAAGGAEWSFVGFERTGPLLWQLIVLAVAAVAVLRVRGVLALVGVGLSLLVLVGFVVPAILDGQPAVLVSLVGALAVMFVTLVLTNGLGPQTLAAALGIAATIGLTSVLAPLAIDLVHIDGRSSEVSSFLAYNNAGLSLQGVVVAGIVIGAMGVLADTGVTQASAVMALRRANPSLDARGLYRAASVVGRDHLSATIHTLVLAYTGTALPLLLVLRTNETGFTDALNIHDVAEPIVATVVGCLGLIAAIPLTTGLAALLVARMPVHALAGAGHGHHH